MSVPSKKACSRCRKIQPLTAFVKHQHTRDGRQSQCRECDRKRNRAYQQALYVLRERHHQEFLDILHAQP